MEPLGVVGARENAEGVGEKLLDIDPHAEPLTDRLECCWVGVWSSPGIAVERDDVLAAVGAAEVMLVGNGGRQRGGRSGAETGGGHRRQEDLLVGQRGPEGGALKGRLGAGH